MEPTSKQNERACSSSNQRNPKGRLVAAVSTGFLMPDAGTREPIAIECERAIPVPAPALGGARTPMDDDAGICERERAWPIPTGFAAVGAGTTLMLARAVCVLGFVSVLKRELGAGGGFETGGTGAASDGRPDIVVRGRIEGSCIFDVAAVVGAGFESLDATGAAGALKAGFVVAVAVEGAGTRRAPMLEVFVAAPELVAGTGERAPGAFPPRRLSVVLVRPVVVGLRSGLVGRVLLGRGTLVTIVPPDEVEAVLLGAGRATGLVEVEGDATPNSSAGVPSAIHALSTVEKDGEGKQLTIPIARALDRARRARILHRSRRLGRQRRIRLRACNPV